MYEREIEPKEKSWNSSLKAHPPDSQISQRPETYRSIDAEVSLKPTSKCLSYKIREAYF